MGALIWTEWSNLLAITSALYTILGSVFAIFIRRYFWDMIGSIGVEAGKGIISGSQANIPNLLIVKYPIVQAVNILNAFLTLLIEVPLPVLVGSAIHRSIHLRLILYLFTAFTTALLYQTVFASLFYGITFVAYSIALGNGEQIIFTKHNRSQYSV